ncbi:MAG: SH3 domain-containing protein, partial [Anaerolineae bacterium]|nr:SH3 domain-containing protein [Anaerolineae bacterium]
VRLRAEPTTSSEILTILPYRSTWAATDYDANWYQIVYLDQQGWVSADYLTPIGSCAG